MLLADYLDVTLITLNFQNVAFETQKGFVNTFSALRSFEWYVLKNIVQLEHYDFEHHLCCISIQLRKLTTTATKKYCLLSQSVSRHPEFLDSTTQLHSYSNILCQERKYVERTCLKQDCRESANVQ